jgi:hypothetical protein
MKRQRGGESARWPGCRARVGAVWFAAMLAALPWAASAQHTGNGAFRDLASIEAALQRGSTNQAQVCTLFGGRNGGGAARFATLGGDEHEIWYYGYIELTGAKANAGVLRADLEVVLRDDRVVATHPIPTQATASSSIDAAFDGDDRLHALVDDEHGVYAGGAWQVGSPPPWRVSGVSVRAPRFVRGAAHLVWSFDVDGDAIGTPGRIDWHGVGNAMDAIVWPWFSHGTRAVLVAQTPAGFGPWVVFEPEGLSDTHLVGAAAEARGKVYVAYRHSRPGLAASSGVSYLSIAEDRLPGADSPSPDPARAADPARLRIVSVQGGHWPDQSPAQARMNLRTSVCVEPGSGTALVGAVAGAASAVGRADPLVPQHRRAGRSAGRRRSVQRRVHG